MSALLPWDALCAMLKNDPASARLTFYERTPGPSSGERVELSGKVLANWVNKAANFLIEEFDVEPGAVVGIKLPAAHWRTAYWCLAAWSVGAQVAFMDADSNSDEDLDEVDVLVTCAPSETFGDEQIVVSLPMLARASTQPLPAGAHDEAKELSTFADGFTPTLTPQPNDVALSTPAGPWTFDELTSGGTRTRCFLSHPDPASIMRTWAAGGSVVLVRGAVSDPDLESILTQEHAEISPL